MEQQLPQLSVRAPLPLPESGGAAAHGRDHAGDGPFQLVGGLVKGERSSHLHNTSVRALTANREAKEQLLV